MIWLLVVWLSGLRRENVGTKIDGGSSTGNKCKKKLINDSKAIPVTGHGGAHTFT
jgi:hypothetical protein